MATQRVRTSTKRNCNAKSLGLFAEICRRHGISDATFYARHARLSDMEISEARQLKALDEDNRKLKKFLAEAMLDVATLREALLAAAGGPHAQLQEALPALSGL